MPKADKCLVSGSSGGVLDAPVARAVPWSAITPATVTVATVTATAITTAAVTTAVAMAGAPAAVAAPLGVVLAPLGLEDPAGDTYCRPGEARDRQAGTPPRLAMPVACVAATTTVPTTAAAPVPATAGTAVRRVRARRAVWSVPLRRLPGNGRISGRRTTPHAARNGPIAGKHLIHRAANLTSEERPDEPGVLHLHLRQRESQPMQRVVGMPARLGGRGAGRQKWVVGASRPVVHRVLDGVDQMREATEEAARRGERCDVALLARENGGVREHRRDGGLGGFGQFQEPQ